MTIERCGDDARRDGSTVVQYRTIERAWYGAETLAVLKEIGWLIGPVPPEFSTSHRSTPVALQSAELQGPIPIDLTISRRGGNLRARAYPFGPGRQRPTILWLHGGGFVGGSLDDIDLTCRLLARRAGMTVVSLDYRLAPEHPFPAAVNDTHLAIGWLLDQAAESGEASPVVVGGQSAGATLVAAACLRIRDRGERQVDAQVLCYPWLDFTGTSGSRRKLDAVLDCSDLDRSLELYLQGQPVTGEVSPLVAGSLAGLPPTLVIGAGLDPLRDDARSYADRLAREAVPVSHIEYADTMHAFLNFPEALSAAGDAIDRIALWLQARFS